MEVNAAKNKKVKHIYYRQWANGDNFVEVCYDDDSYDLYSPVTYFKKYTAESVSIENALYAIGEDGSYANRKK